MVRVPTYATYMNMTSAIMANKNQFDKYNFQALTGLKAQSYSGYGMSAYSMVSLEAALHVNTNFMENNKILETEVKTSGTALTSVEKAINEFKSLLTQFSGMDLKDITPDQTGGELKFTSDNMADYRGTTITVNGTQYTFANDGNGNNIDISAAADAEDVMQALQAKVGNAMEYTDGKLKFELHTINGTSSVLNANGIETGKPTELTSEQAMISKQLQSLAFTTMKTLADSLNVSANGKYLFGGGVSTEPPVDFPFGTLEDFQKYYDGINIKYPSNASADLANRKITERNTGDLTFELDSGNKGVITADNAGGFLKTNVNGGAQTTGDVTFNADTQTIKATQSGAFNTYKAGDTMVVDGVSYVVKNVSTDGKTITTEGGITRNDTVADGAGLTFSSSFPVGSVISLNGMTGVEAKNVQVTGVSADGTELYVTVDPSKFPANGAPVTVPASSRWSLEAETYYKGGDLTSQKLVSDSQAISFDVNACDPAFEKMFRALGELAQGNLIDTRDLSQEMTTVKDPAQTEQKVLDAIDLIQKALFNSADNSNIKNADFYTIQSKINSNMVVLNNVKETQTAMQLNLENNVSSIKNVDKTEASVKALLAATNLEASYAVLQKAMGMSLLNYLK